MGCNSHAMMVSVEEEKNVCVLHEMYVCSE